MDREAVWRKGIRIKYGGGGGRERKKKWDKANMLNLFLNFCPCVQSLPRIDQELAFPSGPIDLGFHKDLSFTVLVYHTPKVDDPLLHS